MRYTKGITTISLFLSLLYLNSCSGTEIVDISFSSDSPEVKYGAKRLVNHLETSGLKVNINGKIGNPAWTIKLLCEQDPSNEGYEILYENDTIFVLGKGEKGCLYGSMDLIEQLGPSCDFESV